MIQGTMSSAGKSYIVTGLCRYYRNKGYRVAPFKSQNMALNSFVTEDGLEMGRAQVVQAEACGKKPSVYMNPILLKPTTDVGSQVIVEGRPIGNMKAAEYFAYKTSLIPNIKHAFEELSKENDIIIIEGAGSPAEINLRENDIVNMGLAQMLDVPVILVGDIDPGGVFAQLYGTLGLLSDEERDRVAGLIINKFRGDKKLLEPGIKMLEDKCQKKVFGVVPMTNTDIEQEDSITSAFSKEKGKGDIDIAVIKLPRISNFTDFDAFSIIDGVDVRYVSKPSEMGDPDLIILPGSKSTISDLRWLKETGIFDCILGFAKEVPVVGICGGYQMMGELVSDPESVEGGGEEAGLGLLGMTTVLNSDKTTKQTEGSFKNETGIFSCLNGVHYSGYEIHNGVTNSSGEKSNENIMGTYVHGVFDEPDVVNGLIQALLLKKGIVRVINSDYKSFKETQYDIIAETLEESLDFEEINKLIGLC